MPSPTRLVVGGAIGVALGAALVYALLPSWGWLGVSIALGVLAYEGWTLINRWTGDTISEVVWELSQRPMVPFVFGTFTGWALEVGALPNVFAAAAWGFLMGHFFFQRHQS